MDAKRKRALLAEWRNRHPEMGVISFQCKETGESFLGISKDTKADLNSNRFKLSAGGHPNKQLQALWNQYGESGFEVSVVEVLKYEDPTDDHQSELEAMRELRLLADPKAGRIWR